MNDKEKQQESKINKKQALISVGDINVLINEINFTSHSIQRAKERFNMDETHAVTYIRSS
jgi:exonuclease III